MNENELKAQFSEMLSKIIESIHGKILTASSLKKLFDQAVNNIEALNKTAKKNDIWDPINLKGWNPIDEWREKSGENSRKIKYLREEVYVIYNFFLNKQPNARIRCFNDDRSYDAELIDSDNSNVKNYIEISFPHDGKHENIIEKTISTNRIWCSGFEDDILKWHCDQCNGERITQIIEQKSKIEYPEGTILIIMGGAAYYESADSNDTKPNHEIEKYWDNFCVQASNIPNPFYQIWLVDRHIPSKIRKIK